MVRVHLMQSSYALSDPPMEEVLSEIASLRSVAAGLKLSEAIPDETTFLNPRHLLEEYDRIEDILAEANAPLSRKGLLLKLGSIVDVTIMSAPNSTKNADGERDPEMHQSKKGNQWIFGMSSHIDVDADNGRVRTMTSTLANESNVAQVADLLHSQEEEVYTESGYRGARERVDCRDLKLSIVALPSDAAPMPEGKTKEWVRTEEFRKASMRLRVEHPFGVIKQQFDLKKGRVRGLNKNSGPLRTRFSLSHLWMALRSLMATMGVVRREAAYRERGSIRALGATRIMHFRLLTCPGRLSRQDF